MVFLSASVSETCCAENYTWKPSFEFAYFTIIFEVTLLLRQLCLLA